MREKKFNWSSTEAKTLGMVFTTDKAKLFDLNLLTKMKEFEKCLEIWNRRNLTYIGRITVLKTFALPKIIYPLTVLPNPPLDIITNIKKKMNEFIWKSKVNKVSHKVLIQNYEDGGLKMLDIDLFLIALKASWVKRIIDGNNRGQWKLKYKKMLSQVGGDFFFHCNYHYLDVQKHFPSQNFFRDILESWCKLNYKEDYHVTEQILWNNYKIKHLSKPIVYRSWLQKGIKTVKDILENNCIMSFQQIRNKYDIPVADYLKYHTLISAIPRAWKIEITDMNEIPDDQPLRLINRVILIQKTCKFFYNLLLQRTNFNIKAQQKWQNIFSNEQLSWKNIYLMSLKCTIDTKLRNLQYKFLMRIIPTNSFLFKCNIVSSSLCDLCNREQETILHLFWECHCVQHFWGNLATYLCENGINVTFTKKTICFGKLEQKSELFNFIVLCAKQYIYSCKFKLVNPTLNCFIPILKQRNVFFFVFKCFNNQNST